MKRTLSVFLLICLTLTLFSCKNESTAAPDDNRSAVFRGETISAPSAEISLPDELPACHGGKVLDQILLDNGMILQEEILTDNASLNHWCNVLSASGELLFSVIPADDLGYNLSGDNVMSGEFFRLTDAVFSDDRYILAAPAGICAYSASGEPAWVIYKNTVTDMLCYDNNLLLLTEESGVQSLYKLDPRDGVLSDPIALSGEIGEFAALGGMDILFTGKDDCLYAGNTAGLYQLAFADEETVTVTMIAD